MAGAPKMSESHHKIIGNNLLNDYELRKKQMIYFLEYMDAPSFDPQQSDGIHLNKQAITFRLMNHQGWGRGDHLDNKPSYASVANFMNSIQDYLPKHLMRKVPKDKITASPLWKRNSFGPDNTFAEDTKELLDQMVDRLEVLKEKIEDKLTSGFYYSNKNQYLEILKRRYKSNWSERTEQQVDAQVNGPSKIKICFDDE
jgi:hypothetical protein